MRARTYALLIVLISRLVLPGTAAHAADAMAFSYSADVYPGVMAFRFIYADGPIVPGTARRLQALISQKHIGTGAVVLFNSPGGNVAEALELGRVIRASNFDTEVGKQSRVDAGEGECYSACTLAFLGGVRRSMGAGSQFGVHRISTTASLTSREALEVGQITLGQIVEYVSYMGVRPEFVSELTRASSENINLLTPRQLKELRVVSTPFETTWEIKTKDGLFYMLGTTTTNNGIHKMIFMCNSSEIDAAMLYNSSGEYQESTLNWTNSYRFSFDGEEVELLPSEIARTVKKSGEDYVGVTVRVSRRILERLKTTSDLGFEMLPPSKQIYAGWTSDFASGRARFFDFVKSCH
jgi:hypothetical protein